MTSLTGPSERKKPGPAVAALALAGLIALAGLLVFIPLSANLGKPSVEDLSEHPFLEGPPGASEIGRTEEGPPGFLSDAAGPAVTVTWSVMLYVTEGLR